MVKIITFSVADANVIGLAVVLVANTEKKFVLPVDAGARVNIKPGLYASEIVANPDAAAMTLFTLSFAIKAVVTPALIVALTVLV